MNLKKHALILAVIESLQDNGSWTGKTHVNKAISLLRDSGKASVPFNFVLYKHGPYSFEIESELEQMQSYGAIIIEPNSDGYGVTLQKGTMAELVNQIENISESEWTAIEDVCVFVGNRNVAELERLATASWIRTREGIQQRARVAKRLHNLKPHVSLAEAEQADEELSEWLAQAN